MKIKSLSLLVVIALTFFPLYVIVLNVLFWDVNYRNFVSALIIVHALFRTWETFFTSRDRKRLDLRGDWTLLLSTLVYVFYHFLFVTELFNRGPYFSWVSLFFGLFLYLFSLRLRIWGELALGNQWSIHAVGAKKIRKVRILRIGPYRYVRHPVYLGIMVESVSLSLIANTQFSLLFAVIVFIPIMVVRALMEEKSSLRRFGSQNYRKYQAETDMFFSLKMFLKSLGKK